MHVFVPTSGKMGQKKKKGYKDAIAYQPALKNTALHKAKKTVGRADGLH